MITTAEPTKTARSFLLFASMKNNSPHTIKKHVAHLRRKVDCVVFKWWRMVKIKIFLLGTRKFTIQKIIIICLMPAEFVFHNLRENVINRF